ncbi:MAG: MCE family protein [Deltaproteobacteria bacterium]|nr:MCE family protein [Deltaproteobacteria bacterium]
MLEKISSEAKVGAFVFIGIAILVYMSIKVSGGLEFGGEGYELYVNMPSAIGLDLDAAVRVAGVEVGRVKKIELEDNKAKITLKIQPHVIIGADFSVALKSKGLLGERYVELIPGSPGSPTLMHGDRLTRITSYTDIETLVTVLNNVATDLKDITSSFSGVLGGEDGKTLVTNIAKNIEDVTFRINALVKRNDEKIEHIVLNLNQFSSSLKDVTNAISRLVNANEGTLNESVNGLKTATAKLNETLGKLSSITAKIDDGQGTVGKLINDDATHKKINKTLAGINKYIDKAESFRTYVGYRAEYLTESSDTKSYFSLRVQPQKDKYYLIEVIDDPRGSVETKTVELTPGTSTVITTTTDKVKFSAQVAKRFHNLVIRGGIIESTGGAGLDYYFLKDSLRFTFEAFDFDSDTKPHLKAGLKLHLGKYFHMAAGYDDFISDIGLESAYFGLGFEFEDDDIKYLLSGGPPINM